MKSLAPVMLMCLIPLAANVNRQFCWAEDRPPPANWRPPETPKYQLDLRNHPRQYPQIDPNKTYALYELIDLAEQQNPAARVAWNEVRQASAAVGIANSPLYPVLALNVPAVQERSFIVFPEALLPILGADSERADVTTINPVLRLNYLLFDFGGRRSAINAAKARLFVSGTALTETHEQIALQVTTAYYEVLSAKGLVEAARASLKDAEESEQRVQDQLKQGLATLPNFMNAKAQQQQAIYNLENVTGAEEIATATLAQAVGLKPTTTLKVNDISDMPAESELESSAEQFIDRALIQRPDLLEQVGQIRAADAEIKQVKSALYPRAGVALQGGYDSMRTATNAGPAPYIHQGNWQGQVSLSWTIFDARERRYRIIEAEERKRAAQEQLNSLRDIAANQVWSSYISAKVAFRRLDTSKALLQAAQTSYDAASASFAQGLATYVDVITAEQSLAQARNEQVQAETQVLRDLAQLAYRTGDLLGSRFLQENRSGK